MSDSKSLDEIIAESIIAFTVAVGVAAFVVGISVSIASLLLLPSSPSYSLQTIQPYFHGLTITPIPSTITFTTFNHDSVDELADTVSDLRWKIPYSKSFNCGEMAACLERYLEREGWHTLIVVGKPPFDRRSRTKHAWLLVETSDGYIPVEPTVPKVILPSNPYYDNYFRYSHIFETPYEAELRFPGEFDFWNA